MRIVCDIPYERIRGFLVIKTETDSGKERNLSNGHCVLTESLTEPGLRLCSHESPWVTVGNRLRGNTALQCQALDRAACTLLPLALDFGTPTTTVTRRFPEFFLLCHNGSQVKG